MATVTWKGYGAPDLAKIDLYYYMGGDWHGSDTAYQSRHLDGSGIALAGYGLTITPGTMPAGTITSASFYGHGGKLDLKVSGLSVQISEFWSAAFLTHRDTADDQAILRIVLAGNDTLKGWNDGERLMGFDGNDKLTGGFAPDRLYGGSGADCFVFEKWTDSTQKDVRKSGGDEFEYIEAGRDTIVDFSRAERDKIDLRKIDADTTHGGNQKFSFIGTKAFSGEAGELRVVPKNGNVYIYGDVNGDGQADLSITVANIKALKIGDFYL